MISPMTLEQVTEHARHRLMAATAPGSLTALAQQHAQAVAAHAEAVAHVQAAQDALDTATEAEARARSFAAETWDALVAAKAEKRGEPS